MFWQKNEQKDWPLVLLLGFASLVFFGVLIVYIVGFVRTGSEGNRMIQESANSVIELKSPAVLEQEYIETMQELADAASDTAFSDEHLVDEIEKIFFSVRVPAERRDGHMEAFLAIQGIKEEGTIDRARIRELLTAMLQ
jgi:hypothetical protein